MAENQQQLSSSNTFTGGMVKDAIKMFMKNSVWSHARNATTSLPDGKQGALSTECANILCTIFPYTFIGGIPLSGDQWAIFTTDDTTSEIGIFTESLCEYTTLTGPQTCLGFNRKNLIIGAARRGYDCGFDVYWTDTVRPNRFINTAKIPFIQSCTTVGTCITCVDTAILDCEKLRLAPHFSIPCIDVAKGAGSGTLPNGSYQIAIRYVVNGFPCTDFVVINHDPMGLFDHNNTASALNVTISGAETVIFTEMEVVLVSSINQQVSARVVGIYNTTTTTIYIDDIDLTKEIVPIELLPLNTPALERSDAIYSAGGYLTMVGPYTKPEFNYQLLANNIRVWWACVDYDEKYYHQGGDRQGMNVSYMRDEVYAYYIRWVYKTGDKTASYHIPGLPAGTSPTYIPGGPSTGDSGSTVAYGRMAGYSSNERYDNRRPDIWGPLCGRNIMHHKFPDQTLNPSLTHHSNGRIRIMGVFLDNIALPVDNFGNLVEDIVGYEVLRAVRDGHASVIAKGQVNHMRAATDAYGKVTTLYQNYPYDDLHADRYLTTSQTIGTVGGTVDDWQGNTQDVVSAAVVSFHSPDTTFDHPNLGGSGSLVLYQADAGIAEGSFDVPFQHPKLKLLTDLSSLFGSQIAALTIAMQALNSITGSVSGFPSTADVPMNNTFNFTPIPDGPVGAIATATYFLAVGFSATMATIMAPITASTIQQQILNVINGLVPPIQYARQYNSHGHYNVPVYTGTRYTYPVNDYQYVGGQVQTLGPDNINNLYRNDYVALRTDAPLPNFPAPYNIDPVGGSGSYAVAIEFQGDTVTNGLLAPTADCSRFTLGQAPSSPYPPGPRSQLGTFRSPIVSWYGAYKIPQLSQYGQVDDPKQIPISCVITALPGSHTLLSQSPVLFGGDTYINRYTEKNPFFFFNDWLFLQPTDYTYDYTQYENVPYPRYWVNNSKVYYDFWMPISGRGASKNWHLDELASTASVPFLPLPGINSKFYVESGYFYLFNNGVRDFYVESSVNVGYRDWEDDHSKRFYDPYRYTTLEYMFRSDIIKSDILYKYDYSLSAGRFWNNYLSWGKCLRRDYSPSLAYTCFSYYPRRIHYSLPQQEELIQDNWRIFLPNNYKDFPSQVTAIKEVNESGALILMKDRIPKLLLGLQSIPSSSGTDYTVGSGSLFEQSLTDISNADQSLQYASCQNRLSVVNTPYGLFWVSRDTGKVFQYKGELRDITPGLKYWFSLYLPSQLLAQFPEYPLHDNPLMGVGIQTIYDNINELLYICKKDYKAIDITTVRYNSTREVFEYLYDTGSEVIPIPVSLQDPLYFEDCSWTISYDCKTGQWVSYHDWHPALNIGSKTHFLTTETITNAGASIWRHNQTTGLFCNYYDVDYPFEIEYQANTGVNNGTIESISYLLDSYNYKANQTDQFLMYYNTFDYAIVSNDEQSTGPMILVQQPLNDPYSIRNFPDFTSPSSVGILQSKVENTYRFNYIKDFTDDRFQTGLGMTQFWQTQSNGYIKTVNPLYLDFSKNTFQLKKLRYRNNSVFLRRRIVGNNSLTFNFSSSRNIYSPR